MAKWSFTPVPAANWVDRADDDFWKRFRRQRAGRQVQMLNAQLDALSGEVADELAEVFASDEEVDTKVRDAAFAFLVEQAIADGQQLAAVAWALRNVHATGGNRKLVTTTILEHGSAEDAATAADDLRGWLAENEWDLDELLVALLLERAGDASARQVAVAALDKIAERQKGMRYGSVQSGVGLRQLDREIFRLTRSGGRVRIAGLLGTKSALTPASLAKRLAGHVYFDKAAMETTDDRVIVDLDEFSLTFLFSDDPELVGQVRRTYDAFRHEDRRFIPPPPTDTSHALLVLAVGDDLELPDVVNPMIELSWLLEDFGECVFLQRVGPLSRETEYSATVEAIDTKTFDQMVRAEITPLVKEAGFDRRTARRFDLTGGPRGLHALVAIRFFPKERHRIVGHLAIYYTDDIDPAFLDRYRNKKGEFTPKVQLVTPNLHHSATFDMVPTDPGIESVGAVVQQLAELLRSDWLPQVEQAKRP